MEPHADRTKEPVRPSSVVSQSQGAHLSAEQVRAVFIDYYTRLGFTRIPGASIIPKNDPSLLYINSGMAPLKQFFTGEIQPPARRVCNIQTCIRTNDIDDIGDDYHLSMFEMMGNWTFGTLNKSEALGQSLAFLTSRLGLDRSSMAVTYYAGDSKLPTIPPDFESKKFWIDLGFPESRVYPMGAADNFWGPAGTSGPCGPCAEIFLDRIGQGVGAEGDTPSTRSGRFVELWNPGVFMEYSMKTDGSIDRLAAPNLDAGAGVERLGMMLEGKQSIFETSSILPIYRVVSCAPGKADERARRIITDHLRTASIIAAEGVRPGNRDHSYILRRLIRRATTQAFIHDMPLDVFEPAVLATLSQFSHVYPPTNELRAGVCYTILTEARSFLALLGKANKAIARLVAKKPEGEVSGAAAFELQSALGIPLEVTVELLKRLGRTVNTDEFAQALHKHQNVSRGTGLKQWKE